MIGKIRSKAQRTWLATRPLSDLQKRLSARRGLLGLCYHAVDAELADYPYRTTVAALKAQLSFLSDIFEIVTVETAVAMLQEGRLEDRDRPVVMLTFDDGYRCNLLQATQVLEHFGAPATLFAARDLVRQPGQTYLSEDELVQLANHDLWHVGAHGVTHNVLPGFLPPDQSYEMATSKAWLEDLLGYAPGGFAYPQGQISAGIVALARSHFKYALSTDQRIFPGTDIHQIRRFCPMQVHDDIHRFAEALVLAPFEGCQ